jgi:hypothetical protein
MDSQLVHSVGMRAVKREFHAGGSFQPTGNCYAELVDYELLASAYRESENLQRASKCAIKSPHLLRCSGESGSLQLQGISLFNASSVWSPGKDFPQPAFAERRNFQTGGSSG